jgi:hypothetical protein
VTAGIWSEGLRGETLGVLVERQVSWIASDRQAITLAYLCVVAKRHAVEPFELEGEERTLRTALA